VEIGEITAWRVWRLGKDGFVHSPIVNLAWRPREVMRSLVTADADDGIYASKLRPEIEWPPSSRASWPLVVGRVLLWGSVFEHAKGYRAENARILSFDAIVSWGGFDGDKALALLRTKYFASGSDLRPVEPSMRHLFDNSIRNIRHLSFASWQAGEG
jgi:hypothetical protein